MWEFDIAPTLNVRVCIRVDIEVVLMSHNVVCTNVLGHPHALPP